MILLYHKNEICQRIYRRKKKIVKYMVLTTILFIHFDEKSRKKEGLLTEMVFITNVF